MDTAFTPQSRGGMLADRVAWTPGARTENIVLAEQDEYGLAGRTQDGPQEKLSRANMPFVERFRVTIEDAPYDYAEYHVPAPTAVALTGWQTIVGAFATISGVGSDDGLLVAQWLTIQPGSFPTAPAGLVGVPLLILAVTPTVTQVVLTGVPVASATEPGTAKLQNIQVVEQTAANLFDEAIVIGRASLMEKGGDIILYNAIAQTTIFSIENVGTTNTNRASSPD